MAASLANTTGGAQGQEKEVSTCPGEMRGNGGFKREGGKGAYVWGIYTFKSSFDICFSLQEMLVAYSDAKMLWGERRCASKCQG